MNLTSGHNRQQNDERTKAVPVLTGLRVYEKRKQLNNMDEFARNTEINMLMMERQSYGDINKEHTQSRVWDFSEKIIVK